MNGRLSSAEAKVEMVRLMQEQIAYEDQPRDVMKEYLHRAQTEIDSEINEMNRVDKLRDNSDNTGEADHE